MQDAVLIVCKYAVDHRSSSGQGPTKTAEKRRSPQSLWLHTVAPPFLSDEERCKTGLLDQAKRRDWARAMHLHCNIRTYLDKNVNPVPVENRLKWPDDYQNHNQNSRNPRHFIGQPQRPAAKQIPTRCQTLGISCHPPMIARKTQNQD